MDYLYGSFHYLVKKQLDDPPILGISGNIAMSTLLSLQNTKKSFLNQFCSRYLRMIPVVTTVNFILIVLPLVVPRHKGPVSDAIIDQSSDVCSQNFYKDLTMTANLGEPFETCNLVTWFLSLDLQMFLLFFIPLKILSHNPKKGLIAIGVITAAGLVAYGLYLRFLIPDHLPTVFSFFSFGRFNEAVILLYMHPINYIAIKGVSIFTSIIFTTRKTGEQMSIMNYVYAIIGFIGTFRDIFYHKQ